MKERRNETSISQGKLRQQIRIEEERTSEISTQLHDRIAKIEKLKKRFNSSFQILIFQILQIRNPSNNNVTTGRY